MHNEILSPEQSALLPLIRTFSKDFCLVGGTALALHIGHRQSIDFDLFTAKPISRIGIRNKITKAGFRIDRLIWEDSTQLHLIVNGVKMTFFSFPYPVPHPVKFNAVITMPELKTLSAMKAFALGGRAKWKDYVDLYFLLREHFSLREVCDTAITVFSTSFNEKLFREQLSFFRDIDYEEEVVYLVESPDEESIKNFLIEAALLPL
ncbi:MAG: nucleotidyl transferase AbiEii/AbiGii toxin family protein [Bacteroidetes bacterium]|nr:nucleotidyl transferase AbiEii/AbiGii toxin family protein [Bacteroidota bacterium]